MRGAAVAAVAMAAVAAAFVAGRTGSPRPVDDMPALLAAKAAAQDTWDIPWDRHERKIEALKSAAATQRDTGRRLRLQRELALEYMNAGAAEAAVGTLETLLSHERGRLDAASVRALEADLAFAYFRIGEQGNCQATINASACLMPLSPEGVHRQQLGAAEAMSRYEALLRELPARSPEAYGHRWMLNLAAMQLGRYPDGVNPQWRIDPAVFRSPQDIGAFREIAAERGLVEFGRAGGTVLEDFDNDGDLDLLLSHMGMSEPMAYFRNDGGRFVRATREAGLDGLLGGLNMVQADYDNDGCIDVYVPRGAWYHDKGRLPASLLRNDCRGGFEDVGGAAGVRNELPSQAAVWVDVDGDGWLDLVVGNEIVRDGSRWPADTPGFRLYLNQRDGRFVDTGPQSGIVLDGMVKGVVADDVDGDGRPDLYVSIMGAPNRLYRNLGGRPPRFEDITARAGVAEPVMSFTTWFFDMDNDGCSDLFVSGYAATVPQIAAELLGDADVAPGERPRLYRGHCDGRFDEIGRAVGLGAAYLTMGANFGDLDNDGWLDVYLGTGAAPLAQIVPNQMFRNDEGRGFRNVTTSGGFGHLQKGHGVAFGDIDGRGVQDVVINTGGAMGGDKSYTLLFRNPGHGAHWIKLDLVGRQANRFAVGARLTLAVSEPGRAPRRIVRTVGNGGSFGASPLAPHVGLGAAETVDWIEVRWPDGSAPQRWAGPLAADARYELRQGDRRVHPGRAAPPAVVARH